MPLRGINQALARAIALSAALQIPSTCAANNDNNKSGVTKFVTRPDIQAPLLKIDVHNPEKVTPGFWFLAPYEKLLQDDVEASEANAGCRIGPHIYDNNGHLIWSGACQFNGQTFCDFRAVDGEDGESYLTGIQFHNARDERGRAVIMDTSYNVIHDVYAPAPVRIMNMHEFFYQPTNSPNRGAGTALHVMTHTRYADVKDLKIKGRKAGWIADGGFREVDVATGETLFEWWGSENIALAESLMNVKDSELARKAEGGWNWLHPNSVDKNDQGDFLLSARYTDTVYKISGQDGSILWRLGGVNSSFRLDGFNFSRQHDARWISSDDAQDIISLFDNGADHESNISSTSSGLVVEIDKDRVTAKVVRRWWRPDGELSRLRANLQILPNGHAVGGWSDQCYFSEHTADNEVVFEARAQNEQYVTYRTYKFNFTGAPADPPVLKAFVRGSSEQGSTTDYFVSWNGATEVDSWRFSSPHTIIGIVKRDGFETKFQSQGAEKKIYVEAVAVNGSVIGITDWIHPAWPLDWDAHNNGKVEENNLEGLSWSDMPGKSEL